MVENVDEGAAVQVPVQVVDEEIDEAVVLLHHRARRMGRDDYVGHRPQGTVGRERLLREDVEPGAAKATCLKQLDHGLLIDERAPADIHDYSVRGKEEKPPSIDQVGGFRS